MVVCYHSMIYLPKMSAVFNEDQNENKSAKFQKLVRIGSLVIIGLIILFLFVRIFPNYHRYLNSLFKIVLPFMLTILFTYLLNPLVNKIDRRFIPRWLAILIV